MNMYLKSIENPATNGLLNVHLLQTAFDDMSRNFNEIQMRVHSQTIRNAELQTINKHLTQLLYWIAVTNPQILDEFQTTAHAFDKLVPRDTGDESVPSASP